MKVAPLALACVLITACNSTPSDLREWRASDHDHTSNPNAGQVEVQPDAGTDTSRHGVSEVAVVAWQQNCIRCHGPLGRGDGPQGPSLRATDLSNPAWQKSVSDEAIARVIRQGRGAMPPFNLPDGTVETLVKLVRLLNAERFARPPGEDAGTTDAGTADAGRTDTGRTDAGKTDTGKTDTGKTDTGKTDTGKTDTGKTDTGKTDTGKTDTGKTDTGKRKPEFVERNPI